jgi:iron(III) transport system substrate-binding protein
VRRCWILISCLSLAAATACRAPGERPRKKKLTLYCSAQIEWCQLMVNEFQAKTGIQVSMTRKSSGESYAQIWAERRNPKGDVWWAGTGDAHIQAAEAKLTEPYRSPRLADLHPWAADLARDGEYRATGIYMGVLGFGYNTEWVAKKQIAAPDSWEDLVDPIYRGEVQIANPASSGTAYTMLATIVQLYGEDRGFDYLKRLHLNVNQYTKSGAAPISAAGRGETGIGVVFLHDAVTQKVAGFPITVVSPAEGTGYEIGGMSLIRGARHPENARLFFDWALSAEVQELGARAQSFQVPSNRAAKVPPGAPRLEEVKLIDLDYARFGKKAERTRLLERFEKEVRSLER